MIRRTSVVTLSAALLLVLLLGAVGCSGGTGSVEDAGGTGTVENAGGRDTTDSAKALVDSKCSLCHNLDRVYTSDKTKAEWESTVDRMKTNGLVVTDEEYTTIVDYLGS